GPLPADPLFFSRKHVFAPALARARLWGCNCKPAPLPQLAWEGGAQRRMGCGPLQRRRADCTTGAAKLLQTAPCFPHPIRPSATFPAFAEKGNPPTASARGARVRRRPSERLSIERR